MPKRKKPVPPADERWTTLNLAKIRSRLFDYVREKYESVAHFSETLRIPRKTIEGWKNGGTKGWPSFANLRTLAEHRLSLDWLFTGRAPMELDSIESFASREKLVGAMLDLFRRRLQSITGVGDQKAEQAFDQMVIVHGAEGVLDLAVRGLLTQPHGLGPAARKFDDFTTGYDRYFERTEFGTWVLSRLDVLDQVVKNCSGDIRALFDELRRGFEAYVHDWPATKTAREATLRAHLEYQQRLAREAAQHGIPVGVIMTAQAMGPTVIWAKTELQGAVQNASNADPLLLAQVRSVIDALERLEPQARAMADQTSGKTPSTPSP